MKWLLVLCVAGCTPLVCQTRLQVVRVDDVVAVRCGTEWARQYRCKVAGIVVRGGESRLLCDGNTMAIMPGDVTEVAP